MGKIELRRQDATIDFDDLEIEHLIGYVTSEGYKVFKEDEKGKLEEVEGEFEQKVDVYADVEVETDDFLDEVEVKELQNNIELHGYYVTEEKPVDLRDLNGSDLRRHLCDKLGLSCMTSKDALLKHLAILMN